jgi:hypothetical protein
LERRTGIAFRDDTFSIRGRTIFLEVNDVVIGARRITEPIFDGDIHFHSQLIPLQNPGETDEAFIARRNRGETREELEARLIALARDINHSLVILQKQATEAKK